MSERRPLALLAHDGGDGVVTWTHGGVDATLSVHEGVPRYSRGDVQLQVDDEPLEVVLGPGDADAVAHLDPPLRMRPGEIATTWWVWPLQAIVLARGQRVDVFRPMMRRTVLGPLAQGRVVPSARCTRLATPLAPAGYGALKISVRSSADEGVTLRRVPLQEDLLVMHAGEDGLVLGEVTVTVLDVVRAEAVTGPFGAPAGFAEVTVPGRAPPRPSTGHSLDWLIDGGRSSEFAL